MTKINWNFKLKHKYLKGMGLSSVGRISTEAIGQ